LQEDPRPEVAASGRAILLLIEEIEHLHVLFWDRLLYPELASGEPGSDRSHEHLSMSLFGRLRSAFHLSNGTDTPQPDPLVEEGFHRRSTSSDHDER
jgi:hypothetical protein